MTFRYVRHFYSWCFHLRYLGNSLYCPFQLEKNVFIDFDDEFIWPSLNNNYYSDKGKCYALKNQIGILADGTIIPCCLDTLGVIKLGNIFVDNINDIINTFKYQNMLNGFKNNKKIEELCKHCSFIK